MSVRSESTQPRTSVPTVAWVASATAIGGIWVAILLSSAFAPDFVSGSEHEHLTLAAYGDWIWGLVATAFVILAIEDGIRRRAANPTPWIALAIAVVAIWIGVLVISLTGPTMVTGSDPTTIPFAALGAPILGVFLTWFACSLVKTAFEQEA